MINKQMTEILGQINMITNSVILKYPKTIVISESQDIMAIVDLSAIDQDGFADIGLKDSLADFLKLIKLFPEDRIIDIDKNTIQIKSGDMSSTFIVDNIALMDAYNIQPELFDRTETVPSVSTFDLSAEDIKRIKSSMGVFKDLSELIFTSVDGDMKISLGATNRFNAKSHTFAITKSVNSTKEFEIKIPIENFARLPLSEYFVDVKYNSTRDAYRILMTNKHLSGFKIILTVKV